jgi:hypothetical protein
MSNNEPRREGCAAPEIGYVDVPLWCPTRSRLASRFARLETTFFPVPLASAGGLPRTAYIAVMLNPAST